MGSVEMTCFESFCPGSPQKGRSAAHHPHLIFGLGLQVISTARWSGSFCDDNGFDGSPNAIRQVVLAPKMLLSVG